jgi:hypothetical protein
MFFSAIFALLVSIVAVALFIWFLFWWDPRHFNGPVPLAFNSRAVGSSLCE